MDQGQVKIYRLPVVWRIFYGIFAAIFIYGLGHYIFALYKVLFSYGINATGGKYFNIGFYIFFTAFFTVQTVYGFYFTRLKISPEQIEYHNFGGYVCARWDEITRIGRGREIIWWEYEGIFLKPSYKTPWWLRLPGKEKFIPLGMYVRDWQNSELGMIVKQRAPQIFTEAQAPQATTPPVETGV
jgi:hypothetical protein